MAELLTWPNDFCGRRIKWNGLGLHDAYDRPIKYVYSEGQGGSLGRDGRMV